METSHSTDATPADSIFQNLPDSAALLDATGTIIEVNKAWTRFGLNNGANPNAITTGVNYLHLCRQAGSDSPEAAHVADGIEAVLDGGAFEHDVEYPCHSPEAKRWFLSRVTPVHHPRAKVLVTHVNITKQKVTEIALRESTTRDPMTQLSNLVHFNTELDRTLTPSEDCGEKQKSPGHGVGVLYLDLDGFKAVNDTYGHAAGDEVIMMVANRLRDNTTAADLVARLGGDEFAIMRPCTTQLHLDRTAAQLVNAIERPYSLGFHTACIGLSIGFHVAQIGESPAHVKKLADSRMYQHKQSRMATAQRKQLLTPRLDSSLSTGWDI